MKTFLPALALLVLAGCASEETVPAEEMAPAVEETVEPMMEETMMDSTMTEPMEADMMEADSTAM